MSTCLELIYDRFGIDFYSSSGIQFKSPMMIREKFLSMDDLSISESGLHLSVGNFPKHSEKQIKANDTQDDVTTSVKEKKDGEQYTVTLHFEFKRPTATAVKLCEELDIKTYHVILKQFSLGGGVASRRVIRNGDGQSRVVVTEEKGVIKVDMTIQNVNGVQLIG